MKISGFLLSVLILGACSDSKFANKPVSGGVEGENQRASSEDQEPGSAGEAPSVSEPGSASDAVPSAADPAAAAVNGIELDNSQIKSCITAVGAAGTALIKVTQGDVDLSQLTPNSVLVLEVQGQARIDLTAKEIGTLKGVCILAAGEAKLELDLNASVATLYFYGRGTATTSMHFRETGSLNRLVTDSSGQSRLELDGQRLNCTSLNLPKAGSAVITCNGTNL